MWAAVAGLALVVLTACRPAQAPPPTVAQEVPGSPSAAAASVASPSPRPSPSPARARVPLRLGVTLEPPNPAVGQTFTLSLAISNDGTRPTEGVYVSTSGQWDRYTVISVRPVGAFVRDATGWHFGSPLRIGPGETQSLTVDARADEPSNEQLTFAVREADPEELP